MHQWKEDMKPKGKIEFETYLLNPQKNRFVQERKEI